MRDRLIEDLGQTFRIKRTQPGPGKDRAHLTPADGPSGPSGVGLGHDSEGMLLAMGALVQDIREHVHATLPRPEDKDFSLLKQRINADKKSDPPAGRVALDAAGGATPSVELHVQASEGFLGHVTGIRIGVTDPAFDLKNLDVTITLRGATVKLARVRFARPLVLELNDEIVLKIANLSAGAITTEYAVEGWLRRED